VHPGSELAGYRIDGVEREHGDTAVLRAHDPRAGRAVVLHVVAGAPGTPATARFLERAQRLAAVAHPHLLDVYQARAVDGRTVAVAEAPIGRRLDALLEECGGSLGAASALRITRQLASAVDALEEAGAEPPPLALDRVWVDEHGHASLDGLDAHAGPPVPSSAASLAHLLTLLTRRLPPSAVTVVERARDGAYLSTGQLEDELRRVQAGGLRRRRAVAIAVLALATVVLIAIVATA